VENSQNIEATFSSDRPMEIARWLDRWFILVAGFLVLVCLTVSLMMPSLQRGPHRTLRIRSASNLRQIGQAIELYERDNNGTFPDTFGVLLMNEDITSADFVSPQSNDTPAEGVTPREVAANLTAGGHLSYVYLGRGLTTQTVKDDFVIAYERPGLWPNGGGNILFGDGHVEFDDADTLNRIAAQHDAGVTPVVLPAATQP